MHESEQHRTGSRRVETWIVKQHKSEDGYL